MVISISSAIGISALAFGLSERSRRGNRGKRVLEPIYLIIFGLAIFAFGWIWFIGRPSVSSSEIAELSSKLNTVQDEYERLVKPRKLSDEQAEKIEKFLLERQSIRAPVVVYYAHSNQEAHEYASGFYHAFRRGGWDVTIKALGFDQTVSDGTKVEVSWPNNAEEKQKQMVSEAIARALSLANVR